MKKLPEITKETPSQNGKNGATGASPKPVYITSLSVENIKCFGPTQTLDLTDSNGKPAKWTVILGDNGVGKTTLLHAIFAMFPKKSRYAELEPKDYTLCRGRLLHVFENALRNHGYDESRNGKGKTGHLTAKFHVRDMSLKINNIDHIFRLKAKIGYRKVEVNPETYDLKGYQLFQYGASRKSAWTKYSGNPVFRRANSDKYEVDLINVEDWFLETDYSSRFPSENQPKITKRRKQIEEVLLKVLPEIDSIKIEKPTLDKSPRVLFKTPYGWVRLAELSLGYQTMIGWIVDFAISMCEEYPESSNPLDESATVLVDEIDLHMHPSWQRKIISYLTERFPNVQFIVTAHSPLIVQSAQDANIVVLRREGDHVVIDNNPVNVRHWRIDQLLTSDLFGLESARPIETEKLLNERRALLSKNKLSKKEQSRLKELEQALDSVPTAETQDDIEAMELIRTVAKRIQKQENGK